MGIFSFFKKKKEKKQEQNIAPTITEVKEEKAPIQCEATEEPIKRTSPASAEAPHNNEDKETTVSVESEVIEEEEPAPVPEMSKSAISGGYTGKFEINKSKDGKKFFFNLYASNKVGIATSQMYSSSQSALGGVKSVIANAPTAPIEDQSLKTYETLPYPKWEIYVDNGGKYRFRLSASNGSCVCHSQGYTTKAACKNGIDSIIRSSKNAEIEKTYVSKKDEN